MIFNPAVLANALQSTPEYIQPYTRNNYDGTQESRASLWHLNWRPPTCITHDTQYMVAHVNNVLPPNTPLIPYHGYTIADIPWNPSTPAILHHLDQIQHALTTIQQFLRACQLFTHLIPPEHTHLSFSVCIPNAKHILTQDSKSPQYYRRSIDKLFLLYTPNSNARSISIPTPYIPTTVVDAINLLHNYKYTPRDNCEHQTENYFVSPLAHVHTLSAHGIIERLRTWAHYYPDIPPPNIT